MPEWPDSPKLVGEVINGPRLLNPVTPRLTIRELTVAVGERILVSDLNLEIGAGTFVCVMGTNGVGKTLTLHTLAGLRQPAAGGVELDGKELHSMPRQEVARKLGLLLQIQEDAFPMTALDTVMLGRYPHGRPWAWAGREDRHAAEEALSVVDLQGIGSRTVTSLSGGERERVALATLLVQDPGIWLLDEPTNHLDPQHQLSVLDTLRNPGLAMRYADCALMLYGDGDWEYGPASDLLEPGRLERMYRTPFEYYRSGSGKRSVLLPA